jgi:hypothetical protein
VTSGRRAALAETTQAVARLGLALTIVLSPFRARIELLVRPSPPVYADFTDVLLFWSDIAVLVTIGAWALSLIALPRALSFGPRFLAWPVAGLLIVAWLGIPFATDVALAAYNATRFAVLAVLALYVVNEIDGLARLVIPIGVMVVVQSIAGIAQVVSQGSLGLSVLGEHLLGPAFGVSVVTGADGVRYLRAYGLADHPNILGGVLAMALLLLADPLPGGSGVPRWIRFGVFALGMAGLFVTFSRGAWLALAAGLLVIGAMLARLRDRAGFRSLAALCLGGLLVIAPLAAAFLPALSARTSIGTPIATEARSLDERVALATATVAVAFEHPVLGVGLGALPLAIRDAQPAFMYDYQPASVVLLDAAAETGLLGAACYLVILVAPWLALARRRRQWTPELATASAALAALGVVGLFDYYTWTYPAGRIWAWIVLGLWAVAYRAAIVTPATPADGA